MSKIVANREEIVAIADAIRNKAKTSDTMTIASMADKIINIESGYSFDPTFSYSVNNIEGAAYGFNLNANNYYESTNKAVNSSYSICRVNLNVTEQCNITFDVINYAESNYDYGLFATLDTPLTLSNSADSSVKKSFKGQQSASVVNVIYENVPSGEHFIDIKFIKDTSVNSGNDSLQFKLQPSYSSKTLNAIKNADTDLIAANIKSGINIFGINGTCIEATTPTISVNSSTGVITATSGNKSSTYTLSSANDSDFIASNIKNGINIFGLTGTYQASEDGSGNISEYWYFDIKLSGYQDLITLRYRMPSIMTWREFLNTPLGQDSVFAIATGTAASYSEDIIEVPALSTIVGYPVYVNSYSGSMSGYAAAEETIEPYQTYSTSYWVP